MLRNKKKLKTLLALFLMCGALLSACGQAKEVMTSADYVLSEEGATSKGIKIGDSLEQFFEVYEKFALLISYGDEQYSVFHMQDFLTEDDSFKATTVSFILPTFFVDDVACDTDTLCETYQVEKENLLSLLNSEDFLKEHTVIYEFILFDFQDGVLQNILNSSRDFNTEIAR